MHTHRLGAVPVQQCQERRKRHHTAPWCLHQHTLRFQSRTQIELRDSSNPCMVLRSGMAASCTRPRLIRSVRPHNQAHSCTDMLPSLPWSTDCHFGTVNLGTSRTASWQDKSWSHSTNSHIPIHAGCHLLAMHLPPGHIHMDAKP